MFIENIITTVANHFGISSDNDNFMVSLAMRIDDGLPLTTRQGSAALRYLERRSETIRYKIPKISEYLANPCWERPLEPSIDVKAEARLVGGNVVALDRKSVV